MLPLWLYTFLEISNIYITKSLFIFSELCHLKFLVGQQFKTECMCLDSCQFEAEVRKGGCWHPYTTHNPHTIYTLHTSEHPSGMMKRAAWNIIPETSHLRDIAEQEGTVLMILCVSGIDVRFTNYFLHNLSFHLSNLLLRNISLNHPDS